MAEEATPQHVPDKQLVYLADAEVMRRLLAAAHLGKEVHSAVYDRTNKFAMNTQGRGSELATVYYEAGLGMITNRHGVETECITCHTRHEQAQSRSAGPPPS